MKHTIINLFFTEKLDMKHKTQKNDLSHNIMINSCPL